MHRFCHRVHGDPTRVPCFLSEAKLVKATHGVLTNVRPDIGGNGDRLSGCRQGLGGDRALWRGRSYCSEGRFGDFFPRLAPDRQFPIVR
jgi:hypothetical protein